MLDRAGPATGSAVDPRVGLDTGCYLLEVGFGRLIETALGPVREQVLEIRVVGAQRAFRQPGRTFGITSPKVGIRSSGVTRSAAEMPIWVNSNRAAATVSAVADEGASAVITPP
ncbi:hypothetical protein, partial [Nocardia gipuzkoensis]